MSDDPHPMLQLLKDDPRYTLEAYQFVREALSYAQDELKLGSQQEEDDEDLPELELDEAEGPPPERHITGQQLCDAIRQYALEQYGYMAKVVLNNWGIRTTGDFGDIVYNLISIGWMKKSAHDRRQDFDDVYDFDQAFQQGFQITLPDRGD